MTGPQADWLTLRGRRQTYWPDVRHPQVHQCIPAKDQEKL